MDRTLVMLEQYGEGAGFHGNSFLPYWFLFDGDYSHLNEVVINSGTNTEESEKELTELIWNQDGIYRGHPICFTEAVLLIRSSLASPNSLHVIQCGFLP